MKRASIVVVLVIAIMVAAVLVARFKSPHRALSAAISNNQMALDFGLESLDRKTVHLSDFRGKAVVLNFWATWCQPCKIEMPWFEQLQKQYAAAGLQVIGVAMDDADEQDIAKFAKNLGVDYPILLDNQGVGEAYRVQFLPATFYVARDGKVVNKVFGLKGRDEIEDNIKKALALLRSACLLEENSRTCKQQFRTEPYSIVRVDVFKLNQPLGPTHQENRGNWQHMVLLP